MISKKFYFSIYDNEIKTFEKRYQLPEYENEGRVTNLICRIMKETVKGFLLSENKVAY